MYDDYIPQSNSISLQGNCSQKFFLLYFNKALLMVVEFKILKLRCLAVELQHCKNGKFK